MAVVGIQFSYRGYNSHETFGFYSHRLRGFLRWNRGSAVWVKGSIGQRAAYLIIDVKLAHKAARMFAQQMEEGGRFFVRIVNPFWVKRQSDEFDRICLGFIARDGINLGNENRTFCPQRNYEEVMIDKECQGLERGFRCPCWTKGSCNYPEGYRWLKQRMDETGMTPQQVLGHRGEGA